ncbi:hypothetical protein T484DRAFT_2964528 [Baffinella frigidus]|nr:hypothetical protein T484DRAFT_2964528 [Cryptophyta sp. CCMP2293]
MISNATFKLPVNTMPQYMSPEQATGRLVDGRSDLFAVGVLMYHAVTGKLPFDGPVFVNIVQALMTQPVPDLSSQAQTGVTAHFQRVVEKALAKNPDNRYQSAGEMIAGHSRRTLQ